MRPKRGCGVRPLLLHCHGIGERVGVSPAAGQGPEARQAQGSRGTLAAGDRVEAHADRAASKADRRSLIAESSGPEDFKYPWLSLAFGKSRSNPEGSKGLPGQRRRVRNKGERADRTNGELH